MRRKSSKLKDVINISYVLGFLLSTFKTSSPLCHASLSKHSTHKNYPHSKYFLFVHNNKFEKQPWTNKNLFSSCFVSLPLAFFIKNINTLIT